MEMSQRCHEAARKYLQRRGYEIEQENGACGREEPDFVAWDDQAEALAFVYVRDYDEDDRLFEEGREGNDFRRRFERAACEFLRKNVRDVSERRGANFRVRADIIALHVVDPDHALLRHHVNALAQD